MQDGFGVERGDLVSKSMKRAIFGVSQEGLSRGLNMVRTSSATARVGKPAGSGSRAVREAAGRIGNDSGAARVVSGMRSRVQGESISRAANAGAGDAAVGNARKVIASRRRRNRALAVGAGATGVTGAAGYGALKLADRKADRYTQGKRMWKNPPE